MISKLSEKLNEQLLNMCITGMLFRANISGDELWAIYLSSFTNEQDPVFRDPESSTHNCNHCKNFIRRYGNIIALDEDLNVMTLFDVQAPEEYVDVVNTLSTVLKNKEISNVFFETYDELNSLPYEKCSKQQSEFLLGVESNVKRYTKEEAEKFGVVSPGEIRTFNHMYLKMPAEFVDKSGKSIEAIMGDYRSDKAVFQRGMEEISLDVLQLVRDLINQGSLLNGDAHLHKVEAMIPLKEAYDKLPADIRDNWCWKTSYGFQFAKFKNELIGVLCSELSEGEELNVACQAWNKRVDPVNYMKATAPITQAQIKRAQEFVEENGYVDSFNRRFATIDDIKVSEIKHVNAGDGTLSSVSIFDEVKPNKSTTKRRKFDGLDEVSIEDFMKNILPECSKVEVFLENRLEKHMVTLTAPNVDDSKPIFKWDNNYSWTFNGNLAGKSELKDSVKMQGGNVEGVLRFSIMWAEDDVDNSDVDAHCILPRDPKIYYGHKKDYHSGGTLDIDITQPQSHKRNRKQKVVENIAFPSIDSMRNGKYLFLVNQYNARNSRGFKAEIEFDGQVFQYEYDRPLRQDQNVKVATVTLKDGEFTIEHHLDETNMTKEIYGLNTNQFHEVSLISNSPNHWGSNEVGNKHYFFMLKGCETPVSTRGFHVENLIPELLEHRKVIEVLANTTMIQPGGDQLSGVGFNATVKDHLIVQLSGNFKRKLKINF